MIRTGTAIGPTPSGTTRTRRARTRVLFRHPVLWATRPWSTRSARPFPTRARRPGSRSTSRAPTCHDPKRAGADFSSAPNTVSIGAGWYDVNGEQTVNALYYPLLYWNGRSDSLWGQAAAVNESGVSMNSSRLNNFWVILNEPTTTAPTTRSSRHAPARSRAGHDGRSAGRQAGARRRSTASTAGQQADGDAGPRQLRQGDRGLRVHAVSRDAAFDAS